MNHKLFLLALALVAAPPARAQCAGTRVVGSATGSGDRLGFAVDVEGDRLIAGAPGEDSAAGDDTGAAYVFDRVGGAWTEVGRLSADDAAAQDLFGTGATVEGATALVSATGAGTGAVYAFEEGPAGWTQAQRLVPSGGETRFGARLAVSGDVAAVATDPNILTAAVYVYERAGGAWTERQRLSAS